MINKTCFQDNLLQRFRANMIVTGSSAFEEKQWKAIRIGNISLKVSVGKENLIYNFKMVL